jgi:hypothetical protein
MQVWPPFEIKYLKIVETKPIPMCVFHCCNNAQLQCHSFLHFAAIPSPFKNVLLYVKGANLELRFQKMFLILFRLINGQ